MYLYILEGYKSEKERQLQTENLICRALDLYEAETGADFSGYSREIRRQEKGKPYFTQIPVQFSVSHTADLWVCLMAEGTEPVGVDVQLIRDAAYEKVAGRYYTEDERQWMESRGRDGFFQIWARKEAYAKFTGEGITKKLSAVSTLHCEEAEFMDFDIKQGMKGSCCVGKKGELWIRKI